MIITITMKNVYKDIINIIGLSVLISFTVVMLSMAILAKGALIYFYEPNKWVWLIEVILGGFGVLIGFINMIDLIK
ncbi:hypothetical protein DRP07_06710 [Archaeoglobales archaeon]|nr:MAG: hypothetical protein DRP07_06710 [Archaeoglobales archaeon]